MLQTTCIHLHAHGVIYVFIVLHFTKHAHVFMHCCPKLHCKIHGLCYHFTRTLPVHPYHYSITHTSRSTTMHSYIHLHHNKLTHTNQQKEASAYLHVHIYIMYVYVNSMIHKYNYAYMQVYNYSILKWWYVGLELA